MLIPQKENEVMLIWLRLELQWAQDQLNSYHRMLTKCLPVYIEGHIDHA